MFVKEHDEFPCANGIRKLLGRPRPSSTTEGNRYREDDVEIEEGDKQGSKTEDSWCITRHQEEPCSKLHDPVNETIPDPIGIRRRDETDSNEF